MSSTINPGGSEFSRPGGDLVRRHFQISGQVQGVGFRPFVYRLAVELGLTGWVLNDSHGVTIELQGAAASTARFASRLRSELPPLASIVDFAEITLPLMVGEDRFEIRPSQGGELVDAQITVDTATCGDCLREMADPADPRHRYPFINCTNCGPRYSIVTRIPYDRPNTTMADFAMCPYCGGQYGDPSDRRFHAQPVACPKCGPGVWLVDNQGKQIPCQDAVEESAKMLRAGHIVAIKGLGGFHLACRADDQGAVARLRERKRRDAKPFAVMVADMDQARRLCHISPLAQELLCDPRRPIVVLPLRKESAAVAACVAQGLDTLGILLPYTPLHHLLMGQGLPPLVMTSGNFSHEPLIKDNEDAISQLGRIVDALLLHNRRIQRRLDDSVVQVDDRGTVTMLRRGRGYAPKPVQLPLTQQEHGVAVLAVGAELKNTVCLYKDGRAVLSEHIGDLKDGRTYRHFIDTINHLEQLFEFQPQVIAADMHPQYLCTEYAMKRHRGELAGRPPLPVVRVQHHHAHIAACMAEHGRSEPVIGIAADGVGYGDDGAIWGCEILRADLRDYERLGHLRYISMPGGDAASVETYRPALAALHDTFDSSRLRLTRACRWQVKNQQIDHVLEMLTLGVNCPQTSSLGRWFDAVAAMLGIAEANNFEGEAPMKLQAAIEPGVTEAYRYRLAAGGPFVIDLRPMMEDLVADLTAGASSGSVAAKFHNTVVAFLGDSAQRAREETGLAVVALSGGCFANSYLTSRLTDLLEAAGFEVLRHVDTPCNDGCVALGQAVVAAARQLNKAQQRAAHRTQDKL